jgi:hypothetical protein
VLPASKAGSGFAPLLLPLRPADARLQPRDTRLTAAFLLLFACAVAGAVFVAVPRGVSVGEIGVKTDRMSWNTTKVGCWKGTQGGASVPAAACGAAARAGSLPAA